MGVGKVNQGSAQPHFTVEVHFSSHGYLLHCDGVLLEMDRKRKLPLGKQLCMLSGIG